LRARSAATGAIHAKPLSQVEAIVSSSFYVFYMIFITMFFIFICTNISTFALSI